MSGAMCKLALSVFSERHVPVMGYLIIKVLIGFFVTTWAMLAGFGTKKNNRAQVFKGRAGTVVNLIVLFVGVAFFAWGFFPIIADRFPSQKSQ